MPLYFGHKNNKGLSVSPSLQALGIDMLRAAPHQVGCVARPLVVQHGYASYICHLPAFLKAFNDQKSIPFNKAGYPASLPLDQCLPMDGPPLVIDFKGPVPSKHIESLNKIGFERIRVNRTDNIVRIPKLNFEQAREIRNMTPNATTPTPINAVNLQAYEMWILVLRLVSNVLLAHTYPAFTDDDHRIEELDELTEELTRKREAIDPLQSAPKRVREEAGLPVNPDEIDMELDDVEETPKTDTVLLTRAKPARRGVLGWGSPEHLPNASGLFFPYIPELSSFDKVTIPNLIETYLIQSLGDKPEKQIERIERIRSAWGLIGQTDAGNVMAHLGKVLHMSLQCQARTFPIIRDGTYQGVVLSGARLFIGMNGVVYRPIPFAKLQEETGSYHMHSKVLDRILEIADDDEITERPATMRSLRKALLAATMTEEDRDEIRRLAVHLHFANDKFLAVNAQSIGMVIDELEAPESDENDDLPMHHSALFSKDGVFVALSAFGYQAPSFMIDNCPKVLLTQAKAPNTLVVRQKPLDLAVVDWKKLLESKEMRNNPRNLSRANRDRSLVGNDKTVVWGRLNKMATDVGGVAIDKSGADMEQLELGDDGLDDW
nr:MAG: hypothetical protein [Downy mildew lesion associated ambivirus 6]